MANIQRQTNLHSGSESLLRDAADPDNENRPLTDAELRQELLRREQMMQEGCAPDGAATDQWRVYSEAIAVLSANDKPLRLVLQASAGTGKSFLLETLFLWCHLNGHTVKAGAPTGIAAARLRVPRTPVCATTLRYLFALSVDGESKLDPTNAEDEGTKRLASMTVLMLDEGSMIDAPFWRCIRDQLSSVGAMSAARASDRHPKEDAFGRVHIIVALDLKQLPLATSQPHFFAGDPEVFDVFDFRVLRQNRRIAVSGQDLDAFHGVLEDVAHGQASRRVRRALIGAYVRGAFKNQDTVKFDNSIAWCVHEASQRSLEWTSSKEDWQAIQALSAHQGSVPSSRVAESLDSRQRRAGHSPNRAAAVATDAASSRAVAGGSAIVGRAAPALHARHARREQ